MDVKKKMIKVKNEWITAMMATWVFGLLAHAYRFFNFLPIWDSMHNFVGTGATYSSGRWFLAFVGKISTDYDMPWVNGALSLFYIGMVVILMTELFELKTKWSICLTAALIVTFPTVTSTFTYMFTADGYMLAFLLAVLGVFLTEKYRLGFLAGAIAVCLSMSIYQAYLSVSLLVVLAVCIKHVVVDEKDIWYVIKKEYKQGIAIVGGAILNKVLTTVINRFMGIALVAYQGINDVHMLTIEDSLKAVEKVNLWFRMFFQIGEQAKNNGYSLLNQAIFVMIIVMTICLIIKKELYKRPLSLICIVVMYGCMPMLAYVIRFVSMEVSYHTLMVMCLCMVYVVPVMYFEHMAGDTKLEKIMKAGTLVVLCGIVYWNTLNANYCYFNMNLSYEKSYAISLDVLERVEEIPGFSETSKIAVIGEFSHGAEALKEEVPEIAGAGNDVFLRLPEHYFAMWSYCMGRDYIPATEDEIAAIKRSTDYQKMSVYPYAGCVDMVDDIVVVKLSKETAN